VLRRVVVFVVAVAVLAAGSLAFSAEMRSARSDAAEAGASALAYRVERARIAATLASTRADLERTWDARTVRHAERVTLDRRLQALYSRLLGVNEKLSDLVASSELHVLNLDATKRCLLGVQRATEQAAVDDTVGSFASLGAVAPSCNRARAVGKSS
jgi:hypothetical protein